MIELDAKCANCALWETPDNLTGTCHDLAGVLRYAKETWVQGSLRITTQANTSCRSFEASEEALREAEEAERDLSFLKSESGFSYPASL